MTDNQRYGYPPVFTVNAAGRIPQQHHFQQGAGMAEPVLVPCWNFPPARDHYKKRSCGGISGTAGTLLVMILLMVFAVLGIGAYQVMKLQKEMEQLKEEMQKQTESTSPQKLIAQDIEHIDETKHTQAAHLAGLFTDNASKTLKWRSKHGRAFLTGVLYQDGGLQVNETGLYFVYSRVEFLANNCQKRDSVSHIVYMKREKNELKLMTDLQEGFCQAGSREVWTAGSNLGSIQELKQGDWVFVNVSQPAMVTADHNSNYFGLFKLP